MNTKIEWCHATFNPWIGCAKVSPACDNCYAERSTAANALHVVWGPNQPRHRTSASNWAQPVKWNATAARLDVRYRVFCASLADVFDNQAPDEWRRDLAALILATPHLDWLLLTKRIGNADKMLAAMFPGGIPENVWVGATITSQSEADRDIPKLLALPAAVRFLSMEPLLGPVDLTSVKRHEESGCGDPENPDYWTYYDDVLSGFRANKCGGITDKRRYAVNWVIVGGESGATDSRPMHPGWVRELREQCHAGGVAFHFKQWGDWLPFGCESACLRTDAPGSYFARVDGKEYRGGSIRFLTSDGQYNRDAEWAVRVGKKAAGRLLDGLLHDDYPGRPSPEPGVGSGG